MPSEQYFTPVPTAESRPRAFVCSFAGRDFTFMTDAGVFSKGELDNGTRLLLSCLRADTEGRLLDLGCGWGAVGVIAGALCPRVSVVMTDVNERAGALARDNAARNGVSADVYVGDGLKHLPRKFNHILLNPPIRAGKQTVYRLFDEAAGKLTPGGRLYVVIRKQQGADSAKKHLEGLFHAVSVAARGGGFRVFECTERMIRDV